MSISRAQQARLGIFVIVGTILLVVFAAVPLGIKLTDKYNTYIAFFKGESLSGLEQGAVVKFQGVPIGKVEKIAYLPDDLSKVKVTMKIQDNFPMKVNMVATTGALGITGLKYIEITGGTNEAKPLQPGSIIETKISTMSSITGKAESIVAKVELLLNHLNKITDPDSLKAFKEIMENVTMITDDVKLFVSESSPRFGEMTKTTQSILTKSDLIASDINSLTKTLNSSISKSRINATFSQVDSSVTSLKSLADQLTLILRQTREDFTVSMENLREATENANQLTKVLSENPSLLLKGEVQRERSIR